jgi:ferredoxin-thioredoxin reductase catalytic subunit
MKFKINDEDKELVEDVKKGLKENKKKFGKPYCPCIPEYAYTAANDDDLTCPCLEFRIDAGVGEKCHCGLYIKTEL